MNIALAITAAGRSLRFGSDKLSYPFSDSTIGETCLSLYSEIPFCDKVVVVNPYSGSWSRSVDKYDFRKVLNATPEKGLSSSVKLALTSILEKAEPDGILFATADMPFTKKESVLNLINLFETYPSYVCSLSSNKKWGKPVIFPRHLYSCFFELTGDSGGRFIIEKNKHILKTILVAQRELTDIDTLQDLLSR